MPASTNFAAAVPGEKPSQNRFNILPVILLLVTLLLSPTPSRAINVTTVGNDGVTTAQITAALQGAGVTISNMTIVNNGCANRNLAVGLFSQGTTPTGPGPVLGDANGVVLGTGPLKITNDELVSPNSDWRWDNTLCTTNVSDPDMVLLEPQTANGEYIAIEFDIVPSYPTLAIPFQFGSDEFPEYVCTQYNDVTGIFVSGPGIAGPYSLGAQNYAKTPAGDLTSINWVNTGVVGINGNLAQCGSLGNTAYYTDNSNGNTTGGNATVATTNTNLELDGWTNYIYQPITVTPGATYHVKAAIADAGDRQWDSGVFFHLIFSTDTLIGFDFGDAPETYRTLTASGGPRHAINSNIYLGTTLPDDEVTGQPSAAANGDDTTGTDDEDGVTAFPPLASTATAYSLNVTVNNTTGTTATLVGWIDFNRNGTFDTSEGVTTSVPTGTVNGTATLNWGGLSGLVPGTTYARFRLTTDPLITTARPGGSANNGEVEDYALVIAAPNLSTSTKSWVDLNGGDQEPGDVIRYTITLTESGGMAATGVSVTDAISVRYNNFSVVSFPAGATNSSTPGTGPLNISNITVPANSSLTIVFDVTIVGSTPAGTIINNTATITVPGGTGGTPAAPPVTVSGGSIPGSGNKPLYLYDGASTPARKLSRTPMATSAGAFVAIPRGNNTFTWTLNPSLQLPVTINSGTIPVQLWLGTNSSRTYSIPVTLQCGGANVATLTQNVALTNGAAPVLSTFNLNLGANYTCPPPSNWTLDITNTQGNGAALRDLRIYPAPSAGNTSNVTLSSQNVINLNNSDIGFYNATYPGGASVASVAAGTTVYVRATVSDPFGSYDISGATVTLTDPTGTVRVNSAAMTQVFDSGAATRIYQYTYAVPAGGPAGVWTARVVATEGTEGTVTDFALKGLTVTLPLPNLTLLKSAQVYSDPVNGTTNPKAIPGAAMRYTLLATNFGTGSADANSLVFVDPIPANTSLFVGDLGQGKPVFFTDGAVASGFVAANVNVDYSSKADCATYGYVPVPVGGYDSNVCNLKVQMNGTMNAASGGNNPSFSLMFQVRIN